MQRQPVGGDSNALAPKGGRLNPPRAAAAAHSSVGSLRGYIDTHGQEAGSALAGTAAGEIDSELVAEFGLLLDEDDRPSRRPDPAASEVRHAHTHHSTGRRPNRSPDHETTEAEEIK